jgi:hypothetical protein
VSRLVNKFSIADAAFDGGGGLGGDNAKKLIQITV